VNRSPHPSIDFKIPKEVWSGDPVDYCILQVFGCSAYAHVNNRKLASQAVKCMFVGYASESKGYRLWCPDSKKVIQNRDITFNETVMFSPGKESVSTGNQEDVIEKVEFEIPADVPQGGDTLPYSSSEIQSEKVNPNIPSPEE